MAEEKEVQLFNKVIVAKHSPENKCNVKDGELLTIIPKLNVSPRDYVPHVFVSIVDLKTKSQYGWVKKVQGFKLDDFIKIHYGNKTLTLEERESIEVMLNSISDLLEETPVAVNYKQREFSDKTMVLTVHKVFFKH
jgi:hypothetical protein